MKTLKVKNLEINTGGILIATLNSKDATELDLHSLDRIKIVKGKNQVTTLLDLTDNNKIIKPGQIGLFKEVSDVLKVKMGENVKIIPSGKPLSLEYIKKKLDGHKLTKKEIKQIVWDIVHNRLRESEITYFVAAGYAHQLNLQETVWLTEAMTNEGDILKFNKYPIMDKHCVGGVAGNRTTMIIVPIIAAAGLTIPKTSSRSITSPSGTADTVEALANVCLNMKSIKSVIKKTNGCLAWGGSLNLAPADDKIITVERPLGIDAEPQLLASVLSKKASVSATHLLIDIPFGKGSKIAEKKEAIKLKRDFELISKKIGIKIIVLFTDGRQPVGNGIGPSLEARDVLYILKRDKKRPLDLEKKSLKMAGIMLEMSGKVKKGYGLKYAKDILESGQALNKFNEILIAQNNGKSLSKLKIGSFSYNYKAKKSGKISAVPNEAISKIARVAGAPNDKGAGIFLHKHIGDRIKKGEDIFTIYAHNKIKLDFAKKMLNHLVCINIRS